MKVLKRIAFWSCLASLCSFVTGCRAPDPLGSGVQPVFDPIYAGREVDTDRGFLDSIVDSVFDSWDFKNKREYYERRGYARKDAERQAWEDQFFEDMNESP